MRRIAVISEHALFRQGMAELLRAAGLAVVATAPATVVVDLDHTSSDTQELLQTIGVRLSDTRLIVIGTAQRLAAASDGVAHIELETPRTTASALLAAVQRNRAPAASPELARAHRRWAAITPRQRAVLRWLALGLDNRAIAVELKITARAVKAHVSALLTAFGLESRIDLALLAQAAGARPPVR